MIKKLLPILAILVFSVSCGESQSKKSSSAGTVAGNVSKSSKSTNTIEYVMPVKEFPSYPFMASVSTGDTSLDNAIRQYQMFSVNGEVPKELYFTYTPAKQIRWGNRELHLLKDGVTLDGGFYRDSVEYVRHAMDLFKSRNDLAKKSTYIPVITQEVFSCQNNNVDFRCYGVSLVITTPGNPGYYVDYNDVVCVKKNGRWTFYKAQFSTEESHMVSRAGLLCNFMKEEGFTTSQIESIRSRLANYPKVAPFKSIAGDNTELQNVLTKWREGCEVISGRRNGRVLNYIYKQGFYNLAGYRVTDSEIMDYYMSEYQSSGIDKNSGELYPYKINYVKTTDTGILVYVVDLVLAVKQQVLLVIPGKNLVLKVPGDNYVKIVDFSVEDDDSVSRLVVELQGILTRTEITQVNKYN